MRQGDVGYARLHPEGRPLLGPVPGRAVSPESYRHVGSLQVKLMYCLQGDCNCCGQLKQEYNSLLREKGECRRLLEDLMRENELKSRECHDAQASLHELQMELMRKSMHGLSGVCLNRFSDRTKNLFRVQEDMPELFTWSAKIMEQGAMMLSALGIDGHPGHVDLTMADHLESENIRIFYNMSWRYQLPRWWL